MEDREPVEVEPSLRPEEREHGVPSAAPPSEPDVEVAQGSEDEEVAPADDSERRNQPDAEGPDEPA